MNYVGKIVFLQAPGDSAYYSGEYVVTDQSPNMLFCVKTGGGYGSHELKSCRFVGDNDKVWTIVRVNDDPTYLRRFVADLRKFVEERHQPRKSWVDSVYFDAERNADRIEAILAEREKGDGVEVSADPLSAMHVCPSKFTRRVVVHLPRG